MHVSVLHPNLLNPNKRRTPEHSLEEAVSLANALDIEILHEAVIPLKKPNAGTLFGSGKLLELSQIFKSNDIYLIYLVYFITKKNKLNTISILFALL